MYNFFALMVASFCIKEPLDFTRVCQIELKFSKFPGGGPPYPPMVWGRPLQYLPPCRQRGQKALFAFFSRLNFEANRQTNFFATTQEDIVESDAPQRQVSLQDRRTLKEALYEVLNGMRGEGPAMDESSSIK